MSKKELIAPNPRPKEDVKQVLEDKKKSAEQGKIVKK